MPSYRVNLLLMSKAVLRKRGNCNDALNTYDSCTGCQRTDYLGHLDHVLHTLGCRFLSLVTQPEAIALFRVVIAESGRFPELGDEFYKNGAEPLVECLAHYLSLQVEQGNLVIDDTCYAAHRYLSMPVMIAHRRRRSGAIPEKALERGHDRFDVGSPLVRRFVTGVLG